MGAQPAIVLLVVHCDDHDHDHGNDDHDREWMLLVHYDGDDDELDQEAANRVPQLQDATKNCDSISVMGGEDGNDADFYDNLYQKVPLQGWRWGCERHLSGW